MKRTLFICSILFVIFEYVKSQEDRSNLYTKRYEHLDIDTILNSPRLVTNYVECLLNKKPCPPEGKELKKILPEALRTKCGRCWPSQKEGALKVITVLYTKYPDYYRALREKWDTTGEYNRRFEEYLRDQKFNSIGPDFDNGEQPQASNVNIVTQRPPRQETPNTTATSTTSPPPIIQSDGFAGISNRFGSDDDEEATKPGYNYSTPAKPVVTQRPPVVLRPSNTASNAQRPASEPQPQPCNNPSTSGSSNSGGGNQHNWNSGATITTTLYPVQGHNPVLNIINRLSLKFANTAEFIAGMLRAAAPQDDSLSVSTQKFHKRIHDIVQNQQKVLFRKTITIN